MANYFGITGTTDSFFNSFFGGTGSTSGSSNILSDYASINSGSYKKLLKAYYAKTEKEETDETGTNKVDKKGTLDMAKADAIDLKESLDALSKNSLYNKIEVEDEDGNVTRDYDKDAIFKKVKQFVDDYNSTIESAGDLDNTSILRTTLWMTNMTEKNSGLLEDIGITINKDNTLAIDETAFKDSNMTNVKSLFSGESGYAASVSAKASSIALTAAQKIAQSGTTYNYNGGYDYSLTAGTMYDSLF